MASGKTRTRKYAKPNRQKPQVCVTLDPQLLSRIDEAARRERRSRTAVIELGAELYLSQRSN